MRKEASFDANRSINVLEAWVAPFNAGAALYRQAASTATRSQRLRGGPRRGPGRGRVHGADQPGAHPRGDRRRRRRGRRGAGRARRLDRGSRGPRGRRLPHGRRPWAGAELGRRDRGRATGRQARRPTARAADAEGGGEGPAAAGPRAAEEAEAGRGAQQAGPRGAAARTRTSRTTRSRSGARTTSGEQSARHHRGGLLDGVDQVDVRLHRPAPGERLEQRPGGHRPRSSASRPTSTIGATADSSRSSSRRRPGRSPGRCRRRPGRNTMPASHASSRIASRVALWKYLAIAEAKAFGGSWP